MVLCALMLPLLPLTLLPPPCPFWPSSFIVSAQPKLLRWPCRRRRAPGCACARPCPSVLHHTASALPSAEVKQACIATV